MTAELEDATPVVEARNLTKDYGHVRALHNASLAVRPQEILALIGDNGAGKSTFVKSLCGAIQPDTGSLYYEGELVGTSTVRAAQSAGIEVVYQDLALAPDLDITQNLFLGREQRAAGLSGRLGGLRRRSMREQARQTLEDLGLKNFPALDTPVQELSGGQQQAVAFARAIMWARVMVAMDEPTAALGVRQTAMVYDAIRGAAARGLSILVISHDIPKMLTIADRVAVMRHGSVVAVLKSEATSMTEVVRIMLGEQGTQNGRE